MAGGGGSDKEEDWPEPPVANVSLVDAPVLFFVATHKAFRADLASIRRVAAEASESGSCGQELVVDLRRRLEFLKLVYNYHSAAEDEVIFLAIDTLIKNVVPAYTLEHKSIEENFSSIFHHLDLLTKKDEKAPQMFQELLFSIGTIQSMICHHMQKEEEQVFPMLMEKFTSEEQSQLVWQYMCSVPFMLLEDFFPWTAHHLSSHEKLDLEHCIRLIMPKEMLLQEVVISWIQSKERCFDADNIYGRGYQLLNGLSSLEDIHVVCPLEVHCEQEQQVKKEVHTKGIYLWHAAIRRDFDQIIEELYQIRSSSCFSSLSSTLSQIKFMADVVIFYSNHLRKVLYPLPNLLSKNSPFSCQPLIEECHIKGLQRLLFQEYEDSGKQSFVEILYEDLKSLTRKLNKNLMFLETEVFPSIYEICTKEMQMWLLYASLRMMPLGLLRCMMAWFSAQLNENQSECILKGLKLGCRSINYSFTSLLYEWVRIGCSGKTSVERFRKNLEEVFNGRSIYLADRYMPNVRFSDQKRKPNSEIRAKESVVMPSSSVFITTEEHGISYPSGMHLHVYFSQMYERMPHLQRSKSESDHTTVLNLESRPMDIIYYFHRALIKDMEYLVKLSADLAMNVGFLAEFEKRFRLLNIIYQIHSDSEDEIAFPALESKGVFQNISHSYCIDHKLESKHFKIISIILNELSELHNKESGQETKRKHYQLCLELHDACLSMHKVLSDHIYREEVDIFPLFRGYFSTEEEEKIVGHMLGRTKAEVLQEMISWLMAYLAPDEQHAVISLWLKVARFTKFDEWLQEWWEGMTRYKISTPAEGSRPSPLLAADPLEVVASYLLKDGNIAQTLEPDTRTQKEFALDLDELKHSASCNTDTDQDQDRYQPQDLSQHWNEIDKKRSNEVNERCIDGGEQHEEECQKFSHKDHPLGMNQEQLEATIRRVSRDSSLDGKKKSCIIQNLLTSRWIMTQKMFHQEIPMANHIGEIPGQSPSYQDPLESTFGCEHYKRNCKLLFPCCNKLYTCIRCHDDLNDHSADRRTITNMMCMQCLVIQPIDPTCSNETCSGFSMGTYYCKICKLFDNDRQIYHCPYCNLCRVGKGLGIDYFHCMTCNACMSRSLFVHACREKCLEDNCPICHEYIFTSNSPVKSLPCGHLMHSACFQDYTCSHYICPICSKTLGDMQVYFSMLDALLAEEKIPEEYSGQLQTILCNDCEKKGTARFHWLYHKCPYCGSYNTRLL
ncbi:zinc finger protein BRUTUS-like At1g74770 [Andrographis paniculata]|uniref:zinc finger protein BRUTUS-like At1g74770 n=1 Tax=Andrographis paniculata TaxID=175694 RepID=UPI0021E724F7|nr:zinc finger protein BRUTUS-like At1g74770 [Andrographis paniculata]